MLTIGRKTTLKDLKTREAFDWKVSFLGSLLSIKPLVRLGFPYPAKG